MTRENDGFVERCEIRCGARHGSLPSCESRVDMDSALPRFVTYFFTHLPCGHKQGNRSKSSACAEQDSVEVMWVADSDDAARVYRTYSVHRSNLMPPTILI